MRIVVYTFAWNEALLVPYFLRHYLPWVDRIVVYDNQSTDGTPELLSVYSPRVEVRPFESDSYPEPEPLGSLRASCWEDSRGQEDWAVVVDFDEFLYHPLGVTNYLARAYAEGHTVIRTFGWQMIADRFPDPHVSLVNAVRSGVPHHWYNKPIVFRPEQFQSVAWKPGCHEILAVGNLRLLRSASLSLLHYRQLGFDYVQQRKRQYRSRMRDPAQLRALGQYADRGDTDRDEFDATLLRAVEVT